MLITIEVIAFYNTKKIQITNKVEVLRVLTISYSGLYLRLEYITPKAIPRCL